ncbi:hypothetical protein BROUX41_000123 [Berkeleyomyces rouxiae]|uniref:uncharacterized protein n=1 Tax=Berkeleyomyces rouxiae TaxID=2035830 RepID=UPI003B77D684
MATATQPAPGLHLIEPNLDAEASNTTSPLSEVEDKDGLQEELESEILARGKPHLVDQDSDSNLSDAGNDTEAETERLYDTPMIQRHKSVILDQFNQDHIIEKTPTRTGRTTKSPLLGSDDLDESYASDSLPQSPLPSVASKLANQKRKRSPDTETSENGQPHLKRSVSGALAGRDSARIPTPRTPIIDSSDGHQQTGSAGEYKAHDINGGHASKYSKQPNGVKGEAASASANGHANTATGSDDDVEGRSDHDDDADVDEEAEAAAKNEEELEKKRIALEEWSAIESRFITFRDRLFKDRLDKLEKEEQSLLADEPYHPEYLAMKQCIDERFQTKIGHIDKEYEYILQAHEQVAVATRTQIWSQFYQGMREKREEFLELLNKDWYDTQNIRRKAHSVPDVALPYPSSTAQQARNAIAYNTEVSILSGLAKHVGFPAVPMMLGASELEVEDDLSAIKHAMHESQNQLSPAPVSSMPAHAPQVPIPAASYPASSRARDRLQAPAASISTGVPPPPASTESTPGDRHAAPASAATSTDRSKSTSARSGASSRRSSSQAKTKEGSALAHGTVPSRSRLPGHVASNVVPPPLRPPMDATWA